ncbi:tubulin-specific chaperone E [Adelges cooleyi]|uniref:tubulin-specific chaperone E n=1 Tax=Adelges cooleyi TaxID=133065 RepID=UPI00217F6661|nr:tubulin-specific chaperone E [Adelges cooleyi]XP_050425005.1 tubulin-specific chaperone E [Adelges cooleyi]XP_050425006.1 tubulin-specific chaperone E [Adelges cooleyi]
MSDILKVKQSIKTGRKVSIDSYYGIVRYVGPIPGTEGIWVGVEWDDPLRGKHDGIYNGTRYFKTTHTNGASFVRPEKVTLCEVSFLEAFKNKYGKNCDPIIDEEISAIIKQSKMSLFEVVGMQKLQEKQMNFNQLTYVNLNHESITSADKFGEIEECCPQITDLELCSNCFSNWETVSQICKQLKHLTSLNLSFNIIEMPLDCKKLNDSYKNLKQIILGNLNYSWNNVMCLCSAFPLLEILEVPDNNIGELETATHTINNLVFLNLENNHLSWSEVNKLSSLTKLECLNLNQNKISAISVLPSSFPSLKYLMVRDNNIQDMESVNEFNKLASLTSLSIQNNPLLKGMTVANYTLQIVSRLSTLTTLNGTAITIIERKHFERDFLKELDIIWHRQLNNDEERKDFLLKYPRYLELTAKYGSDYSEDINTSNKIKTISIKLVSFCKESNVKHNMKTKTLPVTMTLNRLKELSKRLFNLGNKPLEFTYSTLQNPDVEYTMNNMNQSLDYYSVENNDTIFIKW